MSRSYGTLSWCGWALALVLLFRDMANFNWEARSSKTDVTSKMLLQRSHSDGDVIQRQQRMEDVGHTETAAVRHDADADELVSDGTLKQDGANNPANETLGVLDHQEGPPGQGNTTEKRSSSPSEPTRRLHFYVLGFPKCGTTTLLRAFHEHNETGVPQKEICSLGNGKVSNEERLNDLNEEFISYGASPGTKLGIKCPHHFQSPVALKTIATNFADAKLVIGLRHPVLFFQSYYNFRVNDVREGRRAGRIPLPEELVGSWNKWQDVYTDLARYELNLRHVLFHVPKNSLFLYISDQLGDPDEDRAARFREAFRQYLGLRTPLPPFPFGNVNEKGKGQTYEEHMNICDPKHDDLRSHIVFRGNATAQWMRDVFLRRHSVHIGEPEHFLALMDGWNKDPC